jgi:hypothetical protein
MTDHAAAAVAPIDMARIKSLADELDAVYRLVAAQPGDEPDARVVRALGVPLCRLVKMLIPDVHQKCDELVYAHDHAPHLGVEPGQNGADLRDARTGACFEHKKSVVRARAVRCNFNWPVSSPCLDKVERRARVLDSIAEKTANGGGAVLRIVDAMDRELFVYRLDGAFLLEYFRRVPLGKCTVHNMGGARCTTCKRFPRLDKLQAANDTFKRDPTAVKWPALFAATEHAC